MQKVLVHLLVVVWAGATFGAFGFMQDLPEHLKDRPAEDQLRWLNTEFERAYTLQLKVAQERHEERMARRDYMVQTLAEQSLQRAELIAEAEKVTREELESVAQQSNAALGGLVVVLVLLCIAAWWQWGRSVAIEIEEGKRESSQQARARTQELLEALAQRDQPRSNQNGSPKTES
ncbi:MAG: hypothetical protein N2Z21_04385 [Candidatus Sumerlaeaceae bacterium]|nr:hypothetical protein [Candidatus Sumerlaeaceae bacterium]